MTNTNDHKWLIPSGLVSKSLEQEKADWDETHKDYSKNVFSLTKEPKVSETLVRPSSQSPSFDIPNSPEIKILIPGCGSEIYLQKTLIEFCPHIGKIYCTDFSKIAVEIAQSNWQEAHGDERLNNQQLVFAEADSTKLTEQRPDWQEKFDYVLVVNSVLSDNDVKNRQMIGEFYKVLKPGGRVYGFFPTIFWDLEVAYLSQAKAHWLTDGTINLADSAIYDRKWNDRQILYTPLRLNRIFKETGFKRLSFEVYLNDSAISLANLKETHGIDEPDICDWEFLVRFEKDKA